MTDEEFAKETVALKTLIHCRQDGPLCPGEEVPATGLSKTEGHVQRAAGLGVQGLWWMQPPYPGLVYRANLKDVMFVARPEGWRSYQTARADFRVNWCKDHGLQPEVCGPAPQSMARVPENDPYQPYQRLEWCRETYDPAAAPADLVSDCTQHFTRLDDDFRDAWQVERSANLAALPRRSFVGRDLRFTNLTGAQFEGADLSDAQMEGAVLIGAQMEGAVLRGANLKSVDLSGWTIARTSLRSADFTDVTDLLQSGVNAAFGDSSTILPPGICAPAHWAKDAHALLNLDGAGWHGSNALVVADNLSLLTLPPYSPEPCVAKNSPPDCFLNAPHQSKTSGPTCAPRNSPSASSTATTTSSTPAATRGTSSPTTPTP